MLQWLKLSPHHHPKKSYIALPKNRVRKANNTFGMSGVVFFLVVGFNLKAVIKKKGGTEPGEGRKRPCTILTFLRAVLL